ncbi:MAG: hypothetical protein WCK63_04630 [Betaproteobacteria bacterium]
MAIIWAKVHNHPLNVEDTRSRLPVEHLLAMPLRTLLLKLPDLGVMNCLELAPEDMTLFAKMESTAEVLSNWPQGFQQFLERQGKSNEACGMVGFRRRFERFYTKFFKRRSFDSDFTWLRDEFVKYGLEVCNDSVVDNKLLRGKQAIHRFISKSELARRLNISQATLNSWVEKGIVDLKVVVTPKQTRYIADTESSQFTWPSRAEGAVFRGRAAAAYLGLPVRVLVRLKTSGHFAVKQMLNRRSQFHQADLDIFRQQLLNRSPVVDESEISFSLSDVVDLEHILRAYRFHDHDRKADFVVAYLTGEIVSIGRTGESLANILFRKTDVMAFVLASRVKATTASRTQREAASVIGCDPFAIAGLISSNLLSSVVTSTGMRVTCASVEQFSDTYVALGMLAKELKTSSGRLASLCRTSTIPLFQIHKKGKGGAVSFIKRQYRDDLITRSETTPMVRKPKADEDEKYEFKSIAALRSYLRDLQAQGKRLPRRGGKPHRVSIAKACGFDRSAFYKNATVKAMLETHAAAESASQNSM